MAGQDSKSAFRAGKPAGKGFIRQGLIYPDRFQPSHTWSGDMGRYYFNTLYRGQSPEPQLAENGAFSSGDSPGSLYHRHYFRFTSQEISKRPEIPSVEVAGFFTT